MYKQIVTGAAHRLAPQFRQLPPQFAFLRRLALRLAGRSGFEWPALDEVNRRRFAKLSQEPAPEREYILFFTARSGSSRLCDILVQTGQLGQLGEAYNPRHVPAMARLLGATSLDEYVTCIRRFKQSGGLCGTDVTYAMIEALFGGPYRFMSYFNGCPAIWLIREDIIQQAVSAHKMASTGVAHAVSSSAQDRARADQAFAYDPAQIRRYARNLRRDEAGCEALFARFGVTPLRLSYEQLSTLDGGQIARGIAKFLGLPLHETANTSSAHEKLGTDKNLAYAQRFRAEFPAEVAALEADRLGICQSIDREYFAKL